MPTALIFLAEGFEDVEAVTVVDVLRRCLVDVTVAGVGNAVVQGARKIRVLSDTEVDKISEPLFDAVVLPGGMDGARRLRESSLVKKIVLHHVQAERWVAALCAAPPVVLGPWGLLDGKKATCFPGLENQFPPTARFVPSSVVVDGHLITGRSMGTALELSLTLAEKMCGAETAQRVRTGVMGNSNPSC